MELSIPLLAFLGQGEFHVASADEVFKGTCFHFGDECAECFRKQIQIRLFPSFGFFQVFHLPRLHGERTGREARKCVKDVPGVMTLGNAFKDFAEVALLRLGFHCAGSGSTSHDGSLFIESGTNPAFAPSIGKAWAASMASPIEFAAT